jgi:NADH-quinone oxidoreductase subunit J
MSETGYLQTVFFYVIAGFSLFASYFVVTAHNLFRCAVGLIAVLIGIAGLYLLMDAQLLSAIQIAVYVGGIVVLIVFAILMVSDVTQKVFRVSSAWRRVAAMAACAGLFALMSGALLAHRFAGAGGEPASATARDVGRALLSLAPTGFIVPFEVISLVLLAAMVGAITVAGGDEKSPDDKGEQP